jgi:hypothetical protein
MDYTGTSGVDNYTGTDDDDHFNMAQGGVDTVSGLDGNDVVKFGAVFNGGDRIDGGAGDDFVVLDGDYHNGIVIEDTVFTSVETLILRGTASGITMVDGNVAAGDVMTLNVSHLAHKAAGHQTFKFDATAETDGTYHYLGTKGDDTVLAGAGFTAHWHVNGGSGSADVLFLSADITARFSARTMTNIDTFEMDFAHSYHIVTNDANVGAGKLMVVGMDATAGQTDYFDGSAETNGAFEIIMDGTGTNLAQGGKGNDYFSYEINPADRFDGGAGSDTLEWGAGTTTIRLHNQFKNIDKIMLSDSLNFNIVTGGDIADPGKTLVVDNSAARGAFTVKFNDSNDHTGALDFINGAGQLVTVTGTGQNDTFDLTKGGSATVVGGGGADFFHAGSGGIEKFVYNAVSESTSTHYDTMQGLTFGGETFVTSRAGAATTGVDAAVSGGTLSTASFDSDLASAVGAGQMAAHHAVMFTANAGTLSGHTFLVIDENGTAGYQASADLVIDVTGAVGGPALFNFA